MVICLLFSVIQAFLPVVMEQFITLPKNRIHGDQE